MWQENVENGNLKGSIRKLRQAVFTLIFNLRWLTQKTRFKLRIYGLRWQLFLKKAGICEKCLSHTAHIFAISLWLFSPPALADIPARQAIRAIIAEAANQGEIGMQAVAEAIRNRGTLEGVCGLQRESFISRQPKWVHEQARKAWMKSDKSNLVKGAQFWESTDFPKPIWAQRMIETTHVGKHKFYREVRS